MAGELQEEPQVDLERLKEPSQVDSEGPQESSQVDLEGLSAFDYDSAIKAQEEGIEEDIASNKPLVSDRLELSVLQGEYAQDDTVYQLKIQDLHRKYSHIRKTRPDGNCFYRAFGFAHLEALLGDADDLPRLKAVAAKSKQDMMDQGYLEYTIEDFHRFYMDAIGLCEKRQQQQREQLLAHFQDKESSEYVVMYLRLLTSSYLKRESGFFQHFIEGGLSVEEFCKKEVEPMRRESDHIHIIALATALGVPVLVEYMDRGEGGAVNHHVFPEGSQPRVFLLYRPGHYDILYK